MHSTAPFRPPKDAASGGASARGPSRFVALGTCPTSWFYGFELGYRLKIDRPHRLVGSLVHLCLAYQYAARLSSERRPASFSRPLEDALLDLGRGFPEAVRQAREIAEAFKLYDAGRGWAPVVVEHELRATLRECGVAIGAPVPDDVAHEEITARADLVVRINGELWVVDHKTQAPRGDRLDRWRDDGEWSMHYQSMSLLTLARICSAEPVRGVVIQRIKRTLPYDFDHHAILLSDAQLRDALETTTAMVRRERELRHLIEKGVRPPRHLWACHGRYGPCDHVDVCRARSPRERLMILETDFTKR